VTTTHPDNDALVAFLTRSRWFGGKGLDVSVTDLRRLGALPAEDGAEPHVVVELAEVRTAESTDLYQLPMSLYADPQAHLEHALIGWWEDAEHGWVHAYDAVHDRVAMARFLAAFGVSTSLDQRSDAGGLEFRRVPGHELDPDAPGTAFSGEQSNSSVMFGEDSLLKLFRKVTPGRNPDIAVHEVLTRVGSRHVAALYGWVGSRLGSTDEMVDLGMLQEFLRTATDGWELALASVRNLYAEADLHADEVGGDFAGEAARLGSALAEVHAVLAAEFPTEPRDPAAMAELADAMRERLTDAIAVVPELAEHEAGLRALFEDVAHHPGDEAQRIHGDLHLGQTLRTVLGWKIVDFEGEPAKPLSERVLPDSPWRDVAGMLRSFDYAAASAARASAETDADGSAQREFRGAEWAARNRDAFVEAYAGRPLTDAEHALLTAYVADKAVYEAVYETRNRPAWLSIPLSALATITSGGAA